MSDLKLLSLQNIYFTYHDDWILQDWSSSIESCQICHLKGRNGRGKSTLLRIIAGILRPNAGTVTLNPNEAFKSAIAYVGHHLGLHPFLTVRENLIFGFQADVLSELNIFLNELQLDECLDRPIHILSQGQAHKIAIIQMLLQNAQLWVLDEPFANLDDDGEAWLWEKVKSHQVRGGTVVFTAHQKLYSDVVEWHL